MGLINSEQMLEEFFFLISVVNWVMLKYLHGEGWWKLSSVLLLVMKLRIISCILYANCCIWHEIDAVFLQYVFFLLQLTLLSGKITIHFLTFKNVYLLHLMLFFFLNWLTCHWSFYLLGNNLLSSNFLVGLSFLLVDTIAILSLCVIFMCRVSSEHWSWLSTASWLFVALSNAFSFTWSYIHFA